MRKLKLLIALFIISQLCVFAFTAERGDANRHIIFKGLNTKAGPLSLDDGESPNCLNVHTNIFGTLIKRKGHTVLNTCPSTHPSTTPAGNGLFDYAVDTATRKQVAFFGNVLHKMDALDGTWDIVPKGANTTLSDDIVDFENFDGTLIWANWSRDQMQSWDGSASVLTCVEAAPKGKHLEIAYNRVFQSGDETNPLRFYFSGSGSYTSWDTTNDFETLDAPSGDEAMGWGLLRGRLYGFSKYTVNLISNLGGDPLFSVLRRLDGVGCGASRSIQTAILPAMGESMIWVTQDRRIVAWNGSTLKVVSERISVDNGQSIVSMELIDQDTLEKSHSVIMEENGWYVLWIPLSSTIEHGIIWDYKTDTLWPLDGQKSLSSAIFETSNGNLPYVLDNSAGQAHRWNFGNSDNGSAINGLWISRKWDFGWMPWLKKGQQVIITTKTIGNIELQYSTRYNWDSSFSTAENLTMFSGEWLLGDVLPATLGGKEAQTHRKAIPFDFNLFQIKLQNNTTDMGFEIFGLDLLTRVLQTTMASE